MTLPKTYSVQCESAKALITTALNIEKIFKEFLIEGEYYLTETCTIDDKHYLVVTIWNSEE